MWLRIITTAIFIVCLVGCGSMPPSMIGDEALVVNTPIYRANKVFYIAEMSKNKAKNRRWADLIEPHELTDTKHSVRNGEPVTIIVNKAYVPTTLTDPEHNARLADLLGGSKTRDIAVLLDFGARPGQTEQFIAVWYQRDVPPDEPLSFQDLVVYSQDSWDSRVPPYFRLRLFDVTNERNTRTGELLNQVGQLSGILSSIVASPLAGPALNIATRAAKLVLANAENRPLIDYTFQLFSAPQIGEAGGMPLGQFNKGGIIVMGRPFRHDNIFWESDFQYDFKLRQVQIRGKNKQTVEAPFMIATVMTAESIVPNVVKRRSQRIAHVLTDREAVRSGLSEVIKEAERLHRALQTLEMREKFSKFPTKSSFETLLTSIQSNQHKLPKPELDWLISTIRNITQVNLATIDDYMNWYNRCGRNVPFDPEARKFQPREKE